MFPEGIGPIECVNVEHEEVLLIPRWVDCERVTFKYGLGDRLHRSAARARQDRARVDAPRFEVRDVVVSPRDVVAAVLPDPATLGEHMHGRTCAGTWVTGTGVDGSRARGVPVSPRRQRRRRWLRHGAQAVVWQTAINPVVALEMLAAGVWEGAGVLGPEAFDAVPFLDRMRARGEECTIDERTPAIG